MTVKSNNHLRSWYLVVTKPQSEFKAQENLQRQGYETYLPLVQMTRRRNGKVVKRTEALFPRYIFILLDKENDNWAPIHSTIGVVGLVRFDGKPAIVSSNVVKYFKENENSYGLQIIKQKEYVTGDKIEIIEGSFLGCKGIYQGMKGAERVSILLDIVGKNTPVTLSIHELAIA